MKIKCIITDDEPIARKGLRGYIEKVDFLTLTGECEDAVQLNTILKTQEIDLLFLDIEMPEMTGTVEDYSDIIFMALINKVCKILRLSIPRCRCIVACHLISP